MRLPILFAVLAGCGNDVGTDVDALPDKQPIQPRVIAGGGIGDGPIDGVVNLHVIDDVTRMPVANATVRVGTVDGTTDESGLFVATDLTGPQTIVVKASGYRSEVWVGANGANVTIDVVKANTASPPTGTLMASINNFASLAVPAGHAKVALATYSQSDLLGDEANDIPQNNQNICVGTTACNFTLTSRTGKVAVIAAIFDQDLNGTPNDPSDDTQSLLAWAVKTGIDVTANGTQTIALDLIPASQLQDVSVGFGTTPAGLDQVAALVGIETPDGTLQLAPLFATPQSTTVRAPRPEAVASGATYRLTGFATNGQTNPTTSIVLRRALAGTQLSAGTWLAAPTGTPTRTGGSWTAASGATVHVLEYTQGATGVVSILVFDDSTSVTIPDMIAMPSGSLHVTLNAIGAPGFDVTNFSLDADRDKVSMIGGTTIQL